MPFFQNDHTSSRTITCWCWEPKKASSYYNIIILLEIKGQANSYIIKMLWVTTMYIKKGERSWVNFFDWDFFHVCLQGLLTVSLFVWKTPFQVIKYQHFLRDCFSTHIKSSAKKLTFLTSWNVTPIFLKTLNLKCL